MTDENQTPDGLLTDEQREEWLRSVEEHADAKGDDE
jgi:hypothetical protein